MIAGTVYAAGAGTATVLPDFDFETYSEAGLVWNEALQKWDAPDGCGAQKRGIKATGSRVYVEHPTFELLMLAYDLKDGLGPRQWLPGMPYPQDLFDHINRGGLLEAFRVGFEYDVWTYHCVPKLGWPALNPRNLRCAQAKARAHALPGSLGAVGDVLQITEGKMADGKRMITKWTMPRKPTKKIPRKRLLPSDDPADYEKFKLYNRVDIKAEAQVSVRIPDLSPAELEIWQVDQIVNNRGLHIDREGVDACIAIVKQAFMKYNAELRVITNGAVSEASKLPALKTWAGTRGVYMASATEESIDEFLAGTLPPEVRRALEIRQLVGSASVKKLFAMSACASAAQRLHDLYSYYASHTGRWTGNGPQPQNLYKGKLPNIGAIERALTFIKAGSLELLEYEYGDALETVCDVLRSLFTAAPGFDFVCSDFTGIENVVAAGLAGEEWMLEVYRTDALIYEATASLVTGIPMEEYRRHKRETGKHHPTRQTIGKPGALGSQFGGWIPAWKNFGADEFLTDDEIKAGILAWRAKSPWIVEMWGGQTRNKFNRDPQGNWVAEYQQYYGLEGAAIQAVLNPGTAFGYRAITYQMHGDCLYCRLPSGRMLTYHEPRLMPSTRDHASPWELSLSYMGENTNPKKGPKGWIRMYLYGGVLFENVVQAVARDLQAGALVRLEKAGYRPVLHTHDEICGEVPIGWGSVEEFERIMCDVEPWARDWPIKAAGGWRGFRYGKFENAEDAVMKLAA
jgi:DNA polymerase